MECSKYFCRFFFDNTGKLPPGLKLHSDRARMIYPLACNLVIENLQTHQQEFLL